MWNLNTGSAARNSKKEKKGKEKEKPKKGAKETKQKKMLKNGNGAGAFAGEVADDDREPELTRRPWEKAVVRGSGKSSSSTRLEVIF